MKIAVCDGFLGAAVMSFAAGLVACGGGSSGGEAGEGGGVGGYSEARATAVCEAACDVFSAGCAPDNCSIACFVAVDQYPT
ncbi:hypothetical protein [Sorangium sp. So ce1000]|uniref:hypothetical protein n=1 Tax=Sorangium sp. So ce1000 TaxID=3133325 RepID=UPI003F61A2A4